MTEDMEKKIDEIHRAMKLQHLQWIRPKHMQVFLGVSDTKARQIYTAPDFPPMRDLHGVKGWPRPEIERWLDERPAWRRRENASNRCTGLK